jgi:hypothetical protein
MSIRKRWVRIALDQIFPPSAAEKEYYELLGEVITNYTFVELFLNIVIVRLSKIDVAIAKAMFLPLRVDAATNYLNRLIEMKIIKGWQATRLNSILQHLGQISRVRNDIVHLGLSNYDFKQNELLLTNRLWARKGNLRSTKISINKLREINHDLLVVLLHLMALSGMKESRKSRKDRAGAWIFTEIVRFNFGRSQPPALLYKHEQPAARPRKYRVPLPKRPVRPGS